MSDGISHTLLMKMATQLKNRQFLSALDTDQRKEFVVLRELSFSGDNKKTSFESIKAFRRTNFKRPRPPPTIPPVPATNVIKAHDKPERFHQVEHREQQQATNAEPQNPTIFQQQHIPPEIIDLSPSAHNAVAVLHNDTSLQDNNTNDSFQNLLNSLQHENSNNSFLDQLINSNSLDLAVNPNILTTPSKEQLMGSAHSPVSFSAFLCGSNSNSNQLFPQ